MRRILTLEDGCTELKVELQNQEEPFKYQNLLLREDGPADVLDVLYFALVFAVKYIFAIIENTFFLHKIYFCTEENQFHLICNGSFLHA